MAHNFLTISDDFVIATPDIRIEPKECIGRTLFTHLKLHKNKVAQVDVLTDQKDTFGDLLRRSIRTALHMRTKNITRQDVVTLCTKNHLNASVPYIAAQFLGARVASLDPSLSAEEMKHLLEQVHPKILFVAPESVATIEEIVKDAEIVVFGDSESEFLEPHQDEDVFEPVQVEDLKETALIHFSSGTTGLPKGICLSHYGFLAQMLNARFSESLDEEYTRKFESKVSSPMTQLSYTSLYWLSGSGSLIGSILNSSCRLICPDFDGRKIWDLIEKYKPCILMLTPVQIIQMLENRRGDVDVGCVLNVGVIGSSISKEYCLKLKEVFVEADVMRGYGQTEISGGLTLFKPFCKLSRSLMQEEEKIESVGLPIRGITYRVVDLETGKNLGPNQEGELRVKSKFIMNGYHNTDSSSTFDEDGWLKTGDVVYYDEDYCFYVVDRIKEAFKYQGWFIAPAMLENILLDHPAVKLCAVVGVPKDDGHHPMGLVVLKDGSQVSEKEIEEFVEARVQERQRLRAGVKFVEALPLTVTGKVDRRKVKQMYL